MMTTQLRLSKLQLEITCSRDPCNKASLNQLQISGSCCGGHCQHAKYGTVRQDEQGRSRSPRSHAQHEWHIFWRKRMLGNGARGHGSESWMRCEAACPREEPAGLRHHCTRSLLNMMQI